MVRSQRMWSFIAAQIAASPYFHGNRQLVAIQRVRILARLWPFFRVPGILLSVLWVGVNQFHDEIAVGTGGGSKQLRRERPRNHKIAIQRLAHESENIRSVIDEPLIGNLPGSPVALGVGRRYWPLTIRHGIVRIG